MGPDAVCHSGGPVIAEAARSDKQVDDPLVFHVDETHVR